MMRYLADSNLILRGADNTSSMQRTALESMARLRAQGHYICLVPQNLYEFWVVATRPAERNGLGMTAIDAQSELARIRSNFPLLEETAGVFPAWHDLVTRYGTVGVRAHDARLVAAMLVHGITHLLTFNVEDFRRYPEITVVHPADV